MELYQLRYALAVATHESFTLAARSIPVTVASVSAAIKGLERDLGAVLFDRTTRRVRPTEAGELFLKRASKVLADLDAARRDLDAYRVGDHGLVTLGLPLNLAARNLPVLLGRFQQNYPAIDVRLLQVGDRSQPDPGRDREVEVAFHIGVPGAPPKLVVRLVQGTSSQLLQMLRSGEIVLAFNVGFPGSLSEDVRFYELERMETGVALPPGHPLASSEGIELAALADLPMVVYSPGYAMHDVALEVCERAGIRPRIALEKAASPQMLCGLIRAGLGFTIVSRKRAKDMGLAYVPCHPKPLDRIVALAWMRDRPLSPSAALLRDQLYEARSWLAL